MIRFGSIVLTGVLLSLAFLAGADEFSWRNSNAELKENGDIAWKPEAFKFSSGKSLRYIDFECGSDKNDGLSTDSPWKHHPWDPAASEKSAECSGTHTYIFKRGIVYRGRLQVRDSGESQDNPIRLTSSAQWGGGEATIAGSEIVSGWTQNSIPKEVPDKSNVWSAVLSFSPRCLWISDKGGASRRIPLARTPNWKLSDPDDIKSEWWCWSNPQKHFDNFISDRSGKKQNLGIDTEHIKGDPDYFENAVLWTEYGWVMGTPYPTQVLVVDMERKGLGFSGQWGGSAGESKIIRNCRYYLEDKPHYLDDPDGEFWFDKAGKGGILYLRVPDGIGPNSLQVEAGRHLNLIDASNMENIEISGLSFRFTNVYWKLDAPPFAQKDVDSASIRLLGSGKNIRINNCSFEHVNMAVRMKALNPGDSIDKVLIADNDVKYADYGAFQIEDGGGWGKTDPEVGRLYDLRILRNNLFMIGMRPTRYGQGHALVVDSAETLEVSGNVLERCYGSGIHVFGSKRSGLPADRPLCRILIHHNKVVDSMLNTNDWGGIETWQGGPAYVFNNISGNPGGYWHWKFTNHPDEPGCGRFGHAYYLDGAFKNYHFNNIAWGKSKDPLDRLGNCSAFQEIHSYQNSFFNNTIYNFVIGSRRQAPSAGRDKFLANIWDGIGQMVFRHSDPAKSSAQANAADAGPQTDSYAYETNAYSRNIFYDIAEFGVFEANGRLLKSFDEFKGALARRKSMRSDLGILSDKDPLRDPARHDFRPSKNSAAIGRGAKVFVPWSLYAVVGEWNFCPAGADPTQIIDDHWYMAPYYTDRTAYHKQPTFPLEGVGISLESYEDGELEDWTRGALSLDGSTQYLKSDDFPQFVGGKSAGAQRLRSPEILNDSFLIEIYFRAAKDWKDAILMEKLEGSGYSLTLARTGNICFKVSDGKTAKFAIESKSRINDGKWHHAIAECDRKNKKLNIYIDGKSDISGEGPASDISLENAAPLYVGGSPEGRFFKGSFDFLRISQGSISDAKTSLEELYCWQFDGPFLRDFCGVKPVGARTAGAIQK